MIKKSTVLATGANIVKTARDGITSLPSTVSGFARAFTTSKPGSDPDKLDEYKGPDISFNMIPMITGALYVATFDNCVELYVENNNDTNTGTKKKKADVSDFKIKVKLGKYIGAFQDDDKKIYLQFELTKGTTTKKFFIPKEVIKEIEEDKGAVAVNSTLTTNASNNLSTAASATSEITKPVVLNKDNLTKAALIEKEKTLKQSISEYENQLKNTTISEEERLAITEKISESDNELKIVQDKITQLAGGKRKTRRGGATNKRVSKNVKKTHKAKRSGRK